MGILAIMIMIVGIIGMIGASTEKNADEKKKMMNIAQLIMGIGLIILGLSIL